MKLAVALLTYNRKALFEKTYESLIKAENADHFDLVIVDNGSTDGTRDIVRGLGGYLNNDGNHTVGHGMNLAIGAAMKFNPDIVLFTADDYEYKPDWFYSIRTFWEAAPPEIVLAACNIEPDYPWAKVERMAVYGGQKALIRASLPGSNWSFRASQWSLIGPMAEKTGGEDLEVLRRLTGMGLKFAALDLAKHIGERQSAWGNQSWRYAKPLDLAKWGMA